MSVPLLAATNNLHKLAELRAILAPHDIRVTGLKEAGIDLQVVEDGDTFAANAEKKALAAARVSGLPAVADDSGLEVLALNGEPGVWSARYAGTQGNDSANTAKLLAKLRHITDRRARFVCVIAVATPAGLAGRAEGDVHGRIIDVPRGRQGFGYDPVFVPDGMEFTFAELGPEEKNRFSHRANALRAAVAQGLFARLGAG
jgi:XTP/dITP diphosphohydrolase